LEKIDLRNGKLRKNSKNRVSKPILVLYYREVMMTGYECIAKASLFIADHFKPQSERRNSNEQV